MKKSTMKDLMRINVRRTLRPLKKIIPLKKMKALCESNKSSPDVLLLVDPVLALAVIGKVVAQARAVAARGVLFPLASLSTKLEALRSLNTRLQAEGHRALASDRRRRGHLLI